MANRGPPYGEIPMGILWLVVYITMAALSIIVFPFIMFYYEAEEPEHNSYVSVLLCCSSFLTGFGLKYVLDFSLFFSFSLFFAQ